MNKPVFTTDWFTQCIGPLKETCGRFRDCPGVKLLEIGCYEGMSTLWFMQNILTAATSQIVCIDTFNGSAEHNGMDFSNVEARFLTNLHAHILKIRVEKGKSHSVLRRFQELFDIIFIDGSHNAADVLEDSVLSFQLLKPTGVMFFDDYTWPGTDANPLHTPKPGIEAFISVYADKLKVIYRGYCLAVEKLA